MQEMIHLKDIQTTLFDAETTTANGRYIYTRPEVTINNDSNLWLYFGTGKYPKTPRTVKSGTK